MPATSRIAQSALSQADTTLEVDRPTSSSAPRNWRVKANSGTLSATDRSVDRRRARFDRQDADRPRQHQGCRAAQPMFGGATAMPPSPPTADGTFTFAGTGGPTAIPIGDASSAATGEAASRLFVDASGGNVLSDISALSAALARHAATSRRSPATTGDKLTASNGQVAARAGLARRARAARRHRIDADRPTSPPTAKSTRSAIEDTDVTAGDHRAAKDDDDPVGDAGELHQALQPVAVRLSALNCRRGWRAFRTLRLTAWIPNPTNRLI